MKKEMFLSKIKKFLLNAFLPQSCVVCKKTDVLLCENCLGLIEINEYFFCPFCPYPKRIVLAGKCKAHQHFKLNGVFSAVSYQNKIVQKLLRLFKYKPYLKNLTTPLSKTIIAHFLLSENKILFHSRQNSFFAPIPLYIKKEKERGYNQSELLVLELSQYFQIPILKNNLIKIKSTTSQTVLKKAERQQNLKGAFLVKNPAQIQNKIIFLVDDIFTTGSTMEECAKILKQAGAKQVWGIVIAREPLS